MVMHICICFLEWMKNGGNENKFTDCTQSSLGSEQSASSTISGKTKFESHYFQASCGTLLEDQDLLGFVFRKVFVSYFILFERFFIIIIVAGGL